MPKVVDNQAREATRQRIIREAASEFARLGFEQAGMGKGTIYLYFENKRELFLAMLRQIAQAQLTSIRAALAADGSLQERLERLFLAFARLAHEESDSFNVYMSALYGVNRAFKEEATRLLRDYVAVIALVLEESMARGEIQRVEPDAVALMILSLTEAYVLSAGVLGQSQAQIARQARNVASLVMAGIGAAPD